MALTDSSKTIPVNQANKEPGTLKKPCRSLQGFFGKILQRNISSSV